MRVMLLVLVLVLGCGQEKRTPEQEISALGFPGYRCHSLDENAGVYFYCDHPKSGGPSFSCIARDDTWVECTGH